MSNYQPFLISASKTGYFTYLQPWIRPIDAYEPLENATIYRGTLNKRNGYIQLGNTLADENPVMGIMRYQNETTGLENLVVATTQNAYLFDDGSELFNPITSVVDSNFWVGIVPISQTITVTTFWPNLTPTTVSITDGTTIITDDGAGNLSAGGNFDTGGTVNYTTGTVTINFTAAASTQLSLSISVTSSDYFTGTIKNFFNWTNWQATDPNSFVSSDSFLYMVNNKDPITLFDGTNLSRPFLYTNSNFTSIIETALDIAVYQNRLLVVLPIIDTFSNPSNQSIYWSALYNPTNFVTNITGNGGQLTAATGDVIQSFNFLRDICVVRFRNSTWNFRYTGNDFNPFVFIKINVTKRTNCPYASVEYDLVESGIGSTGLTECDGVNLQRFDIPIIDFYETQMSQRFYSQAFSQRYDNNSETWTLYVSQDSDFPLVGSVAPGSDKALIYNFQEKTWATHVFTDPITCLGLYNVITGITWAELNNSPQDLWENQNNTWSNYSSQENAIQLLAGDTTGNVFWMDNENYTTDNGIPIEANIVTTRWNPFIDTGQKVQFGYVDFYYQRNDECVFTISFYVDNSSTPCGQTTLTLSADGSDASSNSNFAMKRVYINAMGEFLQMQMQSSSDANFQINGIILWARPAGRLTP